MRPSMLALALLAGAPLLSAQQQQPAFHEEVVVTATLSGEENRRDLPATTHVVDQPTIQERQAATVAELLASLPGIQVVRSGSAGQPTSVFLRGASSSHVLVLWNGIPLNNPYFGGFNWAFLETDGVTRVEVASGPFSALYGSSAAGGVVQVLTDGSRGTGWRLTLEGGERAYRRGSLTGRYTGDAWSGDLSGHARRGDGEQPNDDFASDGLAGRLTARSAQREGGILWRFNDSASGIPFVGQTPSPERRIAWRELELAAPLSIAGRRWRGDGLLSRVCYESASRDPEDAFGFTRSETDSRAERARATVAVEGGATTIWAVGSEIERLTVTDSSTFGTNLDGQRQRTWAGFGELRLQGEIWGAQLGVRRDHNDAYGGHTSPRGGLVVAVKPGLRLRGSYGQGFRSPSLGELYFPFFGNPELQPERSAAWELGVEGNRGPWRGHVTYFDTRMRDLVGFDESFRAVNVGRARSRGVEVGGGFESPGLSAKLAATWLDARDLDSDLPLRRRARESASATLTWRPGPWSAHLLAVYTGERPDTDPITGGPARNPSYTRIDLALHRRFGGGVTPYARIENVADATYQEALGFTAPGRRLMVGLALQR
jgi:vitamin B12 transporter